MALQEREEELHTQNHRFEVTLANMPHGLCMIDPMQRIVVCNKRYVEMYDLPAHLAKSGTPIADIFEYRIGKGLYPPADDEEYKSKGFNAMLEPSVKTRHLNDGRTILISRQPTEDGGWIAIHDDITEREELNERLEAQNANLDMALQLATSAKPKLPDNPNVDDTIGWVYYKKDLASLALGPLEASLARMPNNPEVMTHLGLTYAKVGNKPKARDLLARARALNPGVGGAEVERVLASLAQ
jgi:tetratricopeptide (TPR) repeat protein